MGAQRRGLSGIASFEALKDKYDFCQVAKWGPFRVVWNIEHTENSFNIILMCQAFLMHL